MRPDKETRTQRRQKRQELWRQPDATEETVQKLNRRMRQAIQEAPTGDGLVVGPMTIAAEHLVPQLQEAYDLEGEEHKEAIKSYLIGCWGEIVHAFPERRTIPGYLEWREYSKKRAQAAVVA